MDALADGRPRPSPVASLPRGLFTSTRYSPDSTNTCLLLPPVTHHHTENINLNIKPPNLAFYHLGSIIAVLELVARAHEEARWLHLKEDAGMDIPDLTGQRHGGQPPGWNT